MERKIAAYYPMMKGMSRFQTRKNNKDRYFRNTKYANPDMKIDYEYVDSYLGREKNSPLFRLSMLMDDCKEGRIELILVYTCKYFGRNSEETLAIVRELLSLPKPVGVYFEYENINTLEDTNQEKLKEALKYWDYDQQLKRRKGILSNRVIHNKPITGEGMILELKREDV